MRLSRFSIILLLLVIFSRFYFTEGSSNEDSSSVYGQVFETSGGTIHPLIQARVSVYNEGFVTQTWTLRNGSYSITLDPGEYTVEVQRSNYITKRIQIVLEPNSTLNLDIHMELSISPFVITILLIDLPDGLYPTIYLDGFFYGHVKNGTELMFRGASFHIIEINEVISNNIKYVPRDPIFHIYGEKDVALFIFIPLFKVNSTTHPWINNWYAEGEIIHLEARNIIDFDNSTRLIFDGWNKEGEIIKENPMDIEIFSSFQIDAQYKRQYLLSINSERGSTKGSGWHDELSMVNISIVETEVGALPLKYRFIGWKGDLVSQNASANILMDGPKEVWVEWEIFQYLGVQRPDPIYRAIITISLLIFAAKILGSIFSRFELPEVLGELFAGVILGPYALGSLLFFGDPIMELNEYVLGFAEIGAILLLFIAGLEISFSDFKAVGSRSIIVGTFGVIIPFLSGLYILQLLDYPWGVTLLVAATLTATSIAITLRTLESLGELTSIEGKIMINSAVIDDVLGLVVLAVVISIVTPGMSFTPYDIFWILFRTIAFWLILLGIMLKFAPRIIGVASRWRARGSIEAIATSICFGSAVIASIIGLSPLVGAFAAGMALASSKVIVRVRDYIDKLGLLFSPIFFAVIGAQFNIRLLNFELFWIILILIAVAIASKILGCGFPAAAMLRNIKKGMRVGIGMVSRGEIGLIIAGIGVTSGIMSQSIYGAVVTMVIVTTILAPIALKWTYNKKEEKSPNMLTN